MKAGITGGPRPAAVASRGRKPSLRLLGRFHSNSPPSVLLLSVPYLVIRFYSGRCGALYAGPGPHAHPLVFMAVRRRNIICVKLLYAARWGEGWGGGNGPRLV